MSKNSASNDSYHTRRTERYQSVQWVLSQPRPIKQLVLIGTDLLVSIACVFFALLLRYGYVPSDISILEMSLYAMPAVIGLYFIGFYKGVTRVFNDAAMHQVLKLFIALIICYQIANYIEWMPRVPRSIPFMYLFLLFIWLWGSRLGVQTLSRYTQSGKKRADHDNDVRENIIIYGAGSAGQELGEALKRSYKYDVVAYIDDNPQLVGAYLLGKRIYKAGDMIGLIDELDVAQVFVALPSVSRVRRRQIIDEISEIAVKIKQLPSLHEIADGIATVSDMRAVNILDVLDRQTVEPDTMLLSKNISGKNVLVTGAGGSIGSELCRQILQNQPKCLVLYELSEFALYDIHQQLKRMQTQNPIYQGVDIVAMLGNAINEDKLLSVFTRYGIQTVYHAAAYKHVPIVEHNPFEGVINNAKGTYHCAYAAMQAQVETFVLISTDKAVRPTNIMGASKRIAELVCQGLSQTNSKTCFSMVRFGNVLGSSGSVIPLFTKQIERGGPITVTHKEVTRYFMTIPEAASLVIQAGAMAKGGEVFVLDMGAPVKIIDLAKRMIYLTGCKLKDQDHPDGDMEIMITGLRPGEKLYEELIIGDDNVETTHHPLIRQAMEHSFALEDIEHMLSQLIYRSQLNDVDWLKEECAHFVEGYHENTESM